MQNQEIIQIIENLKGRRNYEEKKASKLGFSSLYTYFEDKILKEKKANEDTKKELREENDSLKNRVKQLEEEVAWKTKYGDYMNHQYIMSSVPKEEKKEDIKINKVKNNFFSGSLRY